MAVRRLNFTGRKKLSPADVTIDLICQDGEAPRFRAHLQLGGHELPGDARVVVEAYHQTIRMPFAFGTIDNLMVPEDTSLGEFRDAPELARFRVRITDVTNVRGLLLAEVSSITPRSKVAGDVDSLLDVKPAPLGDVPYRLEFTDRVCLEINDKHANWRAFSDSVLFKTLVGPQLLRSILHQILYVEEESDCDGPHWTNQWLRLASVLPGGPGSPPNLDDEGAFSKDEKIQEWIDDAVSAFCRQQRSLDRLFVVLSETES